MKKCTVFLLSATLLLGFTACGGSSGGDTPASAQPASPTASAETTAPANDSNDASTSPSTTDASSVTIDQLTLGEDYTDITADLSFKTHRTDIVDTVFAGYITEFQKMYPNITISYESITDYAEAMTTRISTPDWGDIMMMPNTVPQTELGNYFQPLGDLAVLDPVYNFAFEKSFQGVTYGLPSTSNVQGVLYNKAVFEAAGVTELPKTPDEFLDALQKVKDNTDAIPLYTNFAAGWTMGAWDAYISGSATGDTNFMKRVLPHAKDPFTNRGDGTGPYAVYSVLYEAVARGLIEDDPTTTDWEGSKPMMNRGEIATMVLGSWAIVQMQDAGENRDDIGYMSFPISVGGKQYASAGPDYCYGINKNSSDDNKIAAMLYIKYLIEQSNFDYDQGGIPTVKAHDLPEILSAFDGIEFVADASALEGEEDLFPNINVDSEVGIGMENQHVIDILESALMGTKSLDDIVATWNERWTDSQAKYGVTPE